MAYTTEQLVKAGGQLWLKDGMARIYFNDLIGLYGLEVERYESGNPRSVKLDGEPISNNQFSKIYNAIGSKMWYDMIDGKFHGKGFNEKWDCFNVIVDEIKRRIEAD